MNFFSASKLNKVHMNIKLLVWFIWNDVKFVFLFFTVKYGLERVKNGPICSQKDQITGSWLRKLHTTWLSKERLREEEAIV